VAAVVAHLRLPDPTFDLDGPVGPSDGGPRLRMVWLGDSSVAGKGSSDPADTLPHLVAAEFGPPAEVFVVARTGATVGEVLRRQAPRVPALNPDIVFISVGTNDSTHLHTRGWFARRYRQLMRALPAGVPVVLLGVPDMGAAPPWAKPLRRVSEWRGRVLDAEIRRVAAEADAAYVSIARRTGPTFRCNREEVVADDLFHPNDVGYRVWADAVLDALEGKSLEAAAVTEPESPTRPTGTH
jgi:lysophospholipase L1-like esterase